MIRVLVLLAAWCAALFSAPAGAVTAQVITPASMTRDSASVAIGGMSMTGIPDDAMDPRRPNRGNQLAVSGTPCGTVIRRRCGPAVSVGPGRNPF